MVSPHTKTARPWNWLRQLTAGKRQLHATRRAIRIEPLEVRTLMNVDWGNVNDGGCPSCGSPVCACGMPVLIADPGVTDGVEASLEEPQGALHPLSSIPALNSKLGAAASLYLDFDGHLETLWGSYNNVSTPVFSTDGDYSTYSDSELNIINDVWKRVAEDYAPFNINVTTVQPGSFANGAALRVSIGGNGSWYGSAGGVAYRDSFTNSIVNTVYAFSGNLSNSGRYIAEAVSHEAGHGFGLAHQSSYNASGGLVDAYNPGNANWAPIMGVGYYSARTTFHNGATSTSTTYQDDMAVIARTANGFGYRADDHGNSVNASTALAINGSGISGSGIIEQTTDTDYFSFNTAAGLISLTVNVAAVGANLDARIELRSAAGTLIASAAPGTSLGASLSLSVAAGSYRLVVASQGNYGDVGQYTVSGTIIPGNIAPTAVADSYSVTTNSTLSISSANGVLKNDSDLDGPSSLTAHLVSGPASGVLSLSANGSFVFTPAANYTGNITFVYRTYDGTSYSSNAIVTITVNGANVGPAAANDTAVTIRKSEVVINILANDSDADGINTTTVVIVSGPSHGNITQVAANGTVTYKPTGKYVGSDSFSYRVRDTQGLLSNVATVTVTIGDPPHGAAGRWVQTLYSTVLGRDPVYAEIDYWGTVMSQGATADAIAYSFINSRERRAGIIDTYYLDYLGRHADQGGIDFWIDVWDRTRGPEMVRAGLIGSREYYDSHGGTDSGAIQGLYFDILGRGAGTDEIDYWRNVIRHNSLSHVAMGFVTSDEYRLGIIDGWYVDYLARNCDQSGAQFWLNHMKSGLPQANIQAELLTSEEVWNNS